MRIANYLLPMFLGMIILTACKKTPLNSDTLESPQAAGSFVGWGRPGGDGYNVRLEINGSDSLGWNGTIEYAGSSAPLTVTEVTPDEDSIRFEFIRASTYRYLGVISSVAMTIFVLEPSGQPNFSINRERGGYNLSGDWNGLMYSQFLNTTEDADLFMDQQSNLFDGDVQSQFGFYTLMGAINSGTLDGDGFFFAGSAPYNGNNYPFRFDGSFVNRDSVSGTWQLDVTGGGDAGLFAFNRRF